MKRLSDETIDGIVFGLMLDTPVRRERRKQWNADRARHRRDTEAMSMDELVAELLTHPGYQEDLIRKGDISHARDILAGIRHNAEIRK